MVGRCGARNRTASHLVDDGCQSLPGNTQQSRCSGNSSQANCGPDFNSFLGSGYYDPDMEYVDGELRERHVGEYEHSHLQTLLVLLLGPRGPERRFRVLTEQRLQVSGKKYTYRIPDVCA
jgi:hypothetical protein